MKKYSIALLSTLALILGVSISYNAFFILSSEQKVAEESVPFSLSKRYGTIVDIDTTSKLLTFSFDDHVKQFKVVMEIPDDTIWVKQSLLWQDDVAYGLIENIGSANDVRVGDNVTISFLPQNSEGSMEAVTIWYGDVITF